MSSGPMGSFPLIFNIEYPEQGLDRLSTLFRIIAMLPILILNALIGTLTLALVLMLVFRNKYPRWWFDFTLERSRFQARVNAYSLLLTDRYPSTDEAQSVTLDFEYPTDGLNRFLPLIKWLLAFPHYVVLAVLAYFILPLVTLVAWLAILITGRYPRGLFDFAVGVERWQWRVRAYMSLLVTDRYPPFSLS